MAKTHRLQATQHKITPFVNMQFAKGQIFNRFTQENPFL